MISAAVIVYSECPILKASLCAALTETQVSGIIERTSVVVNNQLRHSSSLSLSTDTHHHLEDAFSIINSVCEERNVGYAIAETHRSDEVYNDTGVFVLSTKVYPSSSSRLRYRGNHRHRSSATPSSRSRRYDHDRGVHVRFAYEEETVELKLDALKSMEDLSVLLGSVLKIEGEITRYLDANDIGCVDLKAFDDGEIYRLETSENEARPTHPAWMRRSAQKAVNESAKNLAKSRYAQEA